MAANESTGRGGRLQSALVRKVEKPACDARPADETPVHAADELSLALVLPGPVRSEHASGAWQTGAFAHGGSRANVQRIPGYANRLPTASALTNSRGWLR